MILVDHILSGPFVLFLLSSSLLLETVHWKLSIEELPFYEASFTRCQVLSQTLYSTHIRLSI